MDEKEIEKFANDFYREKIAELHQENQELKELLEKTIEKQVRWENLCERWVKIAETWQEIAEKESRLLKIVTIGWAAVWVIYIAARLCS